MVEDVLTLHQAADELGVHYMTAYRYVRLGLMDASKPAGTWQVRRSALEAFRNGTDRSPVAAGQKAPWGERMESRLIAGDSAGAWGLVDKALASGMNVDEVYLDVLTPALVRIGERWSAGELDIAIEHRASSITTRLIGQLGPRFVRRGRSRGMVIIASPVGEHHALPTSMLSDLLRMEGWEVIDLGADMPGASLLVLVESSPEVIAVGLSASSPSSLGALAETCDALRRAVPDLLVVVGGGAIRGADHAALLGAHAWATSAEGMSDAIEAHLAELATGSG